MSNKESEYTKELGYTKLLYCTNLVYIKCRSKSDFFDGFKIVFGNLNLNSNFIFGLQDFEKNPIKIKTYKFSYDNE